MSWLRSALDGMGWALSPCHGCGRCCWSIASPPYNPYDDGDTARVLSLPGAAMRRVLLLRGMLSLSGRVMPHSRGAPCHFLDVRSGRCLQYALRPAACAAFGAAPDNSDSECAKIRAALDGEKGPPRGPLTDAEFAEFESWRKEDERMVRLWALRDTDDGAVRALRWDEWRERERTVRTAAEKTAADRTFPCDGGK